MPIVAIVGDGDTDVVHHYGILTYQADRNHTKFFIALIDCARLPILVPMLHKR